MGKELGICEPAIRVGAGNFVFNANCAFQCMLLCSFFRQVIWASYPLATRLTRTRTRDDETAKLVVIRSVEFCRNKHEECMRFSVCASPTQRTPASTRNTGWKWRTGSMHHTRQVCRSAVFVVHVKPIQGVFWHASQNVFCENYTSHRKKGFVNERKIVLLQRQLKRLTELNVTSQVFVSVFVSAKGPI